MKLPIFAGRRSGSGFFMTLRTDTILKGIHSQIKHGAEKGLLNGLQEVQEIIKKGFNRAGGLRSRTGFLRNSIGVSTYKRGNTIYGSIGSNAVYAAIHEFGGAISARGKFLTFPVGSSWVKVASVKIPPRPWLRPGIEQNKNIIKQAINNGVLHETRSRRRVIG